MQTWNVNVEREIAGTGVMVGYFGSHGDRQRIPINLNQFTVPGGTTRPFAKLSAASPILPGTALGNITEQTSLGWSDYKGLWITANHRLSHGLQLSGSYTLSKSTDTNSYDGTGAGTNGSLQNSIDLADSEGPSDFDVRHRVSVNMSYDLPFHGNRLTDGWQVVVVEQAQTGNPLNIVTNISTITGVSSVRPDLIGALPAIDPHANNDPNGFPVSYQWFNGSTVCDPRDRRVVHVVVGLRAALQRRRCRALRESRTQRDLWSGIRQHGFLGRQEREAARQRASAVASRGIQPVQSGELRSAWTDGDGRQHVVRRDQQHAFPDRRLRIGAAGAICGEISILKNGQKIRT